MAWLIASRWSKPTSMQTLIERLGGRQAIDYEEAFFQEMLEESNQRVNGRGSLSR